MFTSKGLLKRLDRLDRELDRQKEQVYAVSCDRRRDSSNVREELRTLSERIDRILEWMEVSEQTVDEVPEHTILVQD